MTKRLEEYSREELIEEIKALKRRKKFGLVWEDKKEDIVEKCKNEIPVLKEVPELAINEKSGESTNLIIEGDNFASLQVLNYTHHGKIDVIYIDPPYNTGNNDFTYNDSYVDSEDSFRHSKWLSFMERRLRLAKELLSDDGVIFISIDDNEQADLKILCDSIFGERNRLGEMGSIIWLKRNSDTASENLAKNHEYICAYQKSDSANTNRENISKTKVIEDGGKYYIDGGEPLGFGMLNINNRPKLGYSFYYNPQTSDLKAVIDQDVEVARNSNDYKKIYKDNVELVKKGYIIIRPRMVRGNIKCWGMSAEKANENIEKYKVVKNRNNEYSLHSYKEVDKTLVKENEGTFYIEVKKSYPMSSVIDGISSKDGTDDIYVVLNEKPFSNPKPVELVKTLISSSRDGAVILDFFAGSGTTGQAVLELNEDDGGNRKFILCTNNENNIARNITYSRVKTVVTGIRPDGSKYSDGISANVRYFTTDFIEKGITGDATRAKLFEKSDEMIQVRENTFEFVDKNDNYTFYKNNEKFVAIIKDPFDFGPIWYELEKKNTEKLPVKLYVFSYSNYTFEDEIPDTDLKYEICAIPNSIMEVYRKISDKKEEK